VRAGSERERSRAHGRFMRRQVATKEAASSRQPSCRIGGEEETRLVLEHRVDAPNERLSGIIMT